MWFCNIFFQCPCAENNRQEVARREKAATEIEIQKKLAKRSEKEKEKAKRDDMIQKRKKKYYESLKRAEAGKYQLLLFLISNTNIRIFLVKSFIYIQLNHPTVSKSWRCSKNKFDSIITKIITTNFVEKKLWFDVTNKIFGVFFKFWGHPFTGLKNFWDG